MDKNDTGRGGISESELTELLASLKVEPAPEADFEARFLLDLRERLARESVCCPARRLLWEHVMQMLANFGPRKLAYSASTLGLGVLAAGFFALPGEPEQAGASVAKNTLTRLEHSLAALRPNSEQVAQGCTTIRICEQEKTTYTDASLAAGDFSASMSQGSAEIPVNMGIDSFFSGSYPSYTTAVGF